MTSIIVPSVSVAQLIERTETIEDAVRAVAKDIDKDLREYVGPLHYSYYTSI